MAERMLDAVLDDELSAVARSTDPQTSWDAARSISSARLRASQVYVLTLFKELGPMTDESLLECAERGVQSPSGLRTRRAELVELGLLRDSERRARLRSGRWAIVWEVAS